MTTDSPLPAHLECIGNQITAAARDLYGPGAQAGQPRRPWSIIMRAPRLALAGGAAGIAAAVAVVAVLFATTGAPPAYALTTNANGSYTLTINDIATAIPALNAKLAQLGIDTSVVPVAASCTAPDDGVELVGGFPASTVDQTVTLDQANIPSGSHGIIAVYQTSAGGVDLLIGTFPNSTAVPTCLNPSNVGYSPTTPTGASSTTNAAQ